MTAAFTRGPMDMGYSQTPHGLWTLEVSTGARCLLGWLHSHSDQFLASVTCNMARRVFNTSSVVKWLGELAEAGFVTVTKGEPGKADSYRLETEPWIELHTRRRHRAETGAPTPTDRAETGAPDPALKEDHSEDTSHDAPPTAPRRPIAAERRCGEAVVSKCERDAIYNAVVEACGFSYAEMTDRQRRSCGVAVSELVRVSATPDEIFRRAAIYPQKYEAALTPNALANQWAALREPPTPTSRGGVMDQALAFRAAKQAALGENVVPMRVLR